MLNSDENTKEELGTFPTVYDFLRPNAFRFVLKELPHVAFTCQEAGIPSVGFGDALQPTPFIDIPRIGDKLQYGTLDITFIIAENMVNYVELYEWIVALGFPSNYNQYSAFVNERLSRFPFFKSARGETEVLGYSDGTLIILDSNNNPKINVQLKDMFPVSLSGVNFDTTSTAVTYLKATAQFKYRMYEIEIL